MQTRTVAVYC